jgi:ABC-type transport system involved in multi-copper enzyme maturation permease subunit
MDSLLLFGVVSSWLKPLWMVAAGAAVAVAFLYVVLFLLRLTMPKLAAVASATGKEALSQPLFWVLMAIGVFLLILFPFIPYNTFGEDIKMVKDDGLTLIMILSVVLALWTASVSIADEIEGKTALTVLSKPIGRWHFVLGKFLGIIGPVAILFIVLGAIFLGTISYKVKYDARETSNPEPTWQQCLVEMEQTAPGLYLAFMETVVLASISVAISTRLPMLPNLIICGSIYVLGHLVPTLAKAAEGQLEYVPFIASVLATVVPMLDNFNIYGAIATGKMVSWEYLGWASLYCLLYTAAAMLVALLLFEDRDLA